MKRLTKKVVSFITILSICTLSSVSVQAETNADSTHGLTDAEIIAMEENKIIGQSDNNSVIYWIPNNPEDYWDDQNNGNYWEPMSTISELPGETTIPEMPMTADLLSSSAKVSRANIIPNILVIDFTATSTKVNIKFTNYGVDSIDYVKGTVSTGSSTKSFNFASIKPGTTTKSVATNMVKCKEDISVYTVAVEGGSTIGSSTTTGSRSISATYLNQWNRGTYSTVQNNINNQFSKNKGGIGVSNILAYVVSASNFRNSLTSSTPRTAVSGSIANLYRYKKSSKYIDIIGKYSTGSIVAYGTC